MELFNKKLFPKCSKEDVKYLCPVTRELTPSVQDPFKYLSNFLHEIHKIYRSGSV